MAIEVVCPACGARHEVPDDRAGRTGRCGCGERLLVPVATSTPVARPSALTVECRHCGMQSRPGTHCEWCRQPFGLPERPVYEQPFGHQPYDVGRGPESPAPVPVVVIRILMLLSVICGWLVVAFCLLGGLAISFMEIEYSGAVGAVLGVIGLFVGLFVGLQTWLWYALGRASNAAWWIHTVLLGLKLVFGPIAILVMILAANTPTEVNVLGEEPAMLAIRIASSIVEFAVAVVVMVFWQQHAVKRWYGVR